MTFYLCIWIIRTQVYRVLAITFFTSVLLFLTFKIIFCVKTNVFGMKNKTQYSSHFLLTSIIDIVQGK